MKRVFVLVLAMLFLAGCRSAAAPSEVYTPRGFRVEGTQLLDANGEVFVIRGVNYPHCWFPEQDAVSLPAIAKTGCNTVRIVCGCGIRYPEDTPETLSGLIRQCRELGMIAIVEVHDITGSNLTEDLEAVADFWIRNKDALIGQEEYAIINIANEWKSQRSGREWSRGYCAVLPRLREAGIRNAILIDAPQGGQYGTGLKNFGREVLEADPQANVLFGVHLYETAGNNIHTVENNLEAGREEGLCVVVGEFGSSHGGRDIDEEAILEYCHIHSIGWLAWSWAGNAPENSNLDLVLDWDGQNLTPGWGETVINGPFGIRETSKSCSIFEKNE